MFVLRHVKRQLRLLRPRRFVPPFFLLAVVVQLLVVSACPTTIKASPVKDTFNEAAAAVHKSQPLTISDGDSTDSDRATTPITVQLPAHRLATGDYPTTTVRPTKALWSDGNSSAGRQRFRRNAFGYGRGEEEGAADLEYFGGVNPGLAALTDSAGLSYLRKYLNSDCVQYEYQNG